MDVNHLSGSTFENYGAVGAGVTSHAVDTAKDASTAQVMPAEQYIQTPLRTQAQAQKISPLALPALTAVEPVITQGFVIHEENDITAIGNPGANYCADPATPADSRYHLNKPTVNGLVRFTMTLSTGETVFAYCLNQYYGPPYGFPYESGPIELTLPGASTQQRLMVAWMLGNLFPATSEAETLALAARPPALRRSTLTMYLPWCKLRFG